MPDLFGIDIAAEVNAALGKDLLAGTLTRVTPGTRTAGSLTAGTNPTTTSHSCRGILEDYRAAQIDGTVVLDGDRRVLLLGASIKPTAVPEAGDRITMEGATYTVVRVERDPAAATYTCQVRA